MEPEKKEEVITFRRSDFEKMLDGFEVIIRELRNYANNNRQACPEQEQGKERPVVH